MEDGVLTVISEVVFRVTKKIKSFEEIKIPEGTTVLICENNELISLRGVPITITDLRVSGNYLHVCEGDFTNLVKLDISNNLFSTLESVPPVVYLRCSKNPLTTLVGMPDSVEHFGCSYTWVTSYEGCSHKLKSMVGVFTRSISLKGLPKRMERAYLANNQIINLEGCPGAEILDLGGNLIKIPEGFPQGIKELTLSNNRLETLEVKWPTSLRILQVSGHPELVSGELDLELDLLEAFDTKITKPSGVKEFLSSSEKLPVPHRIKEV